MNNKTLLAFCVVITLLGLTVIYIAVFGPIDI